MDFTFIQENNVFTDVIDGKPFDGVYFNGMWVSNMSTLQNFHGICHYEFSDPKFEDDYEYILHFFAALTKYCKMEMMLL